MTEIDKIERLRRIINDSGLSDIQFAKKVDINQSSLSLILNRKRNLGANVMTKICNVFSINMRWLANGFGDKNCIESINDKGMYTQTESTEVDKIERIRSVIDDSGLSVLQFANKANLNQSNLSQILRRQRNAGSKVFMRISDTYGVNIQWLMSGNGPKYSNENETQKALQLSEHQEEYSNKVDYKEKYIVELEQQIKLLKEVNQSLQSQLDEKSTIIQGFLKGDIGLIGKK